MFYTLQQEEVESPQSVSKEIGNAEMLDELTTNRGELKVRTINSTEERNYQVNTIQLLFYFDE
jgi:hypothetical protein